MILMSATANNEVLASIELQFKVNRIVMPIKRITKRWLAKTNSFMTSTSATIPDNTVYFGQLPEASNATRTPFRLTQK